MVSNPFAVSHTYRPAARYHTASWYRWFLDGASRTTNAVVGRTFRSSCAWGCASGSNGQLLGVDGTGTAGRAWGAQPTVTSGARTVGQQWFVLPGGPISAGAAAIQWTCPHSGRLRRLRGTR
ncbi:hypothetical protein ACIRYZ_19220 [Kitasatospora sp. NPDC101155]|uniref:hypothetical protein n=1 Tax=Kitasatospora sp. NPDC101155 TaxID=3364097 RepID=UPI00381EF522